MGIDYRDDYTDHLPIEVKFHFYPHVKKRRVSYTDMSARPNVQPLAYTRRKGEPLQVRNMTCEKCGKVLGSVMARRNHEARCNS